MSDTYHLDEQNEENSYTRTSFTEKDVAYCIELAQMLSKQSAAIGKLSANKS